MLSIYFDLSFSFHFTTMDNFVLVCHLKYPPKYKEKVCISYGKLTQQLVNIKRKAKQILNKPK